MAKRGSAISVPDSWLEQCRRWRDREGLSVEAAGVTLARAVKRGRPFADATIRRYLRGEVVTDELTGAFAKVMGVPAPVMIDDAKHRAWYDVGVRLERSNSKLFNAELERLKVILEMAEALEKSEPNDEG